MTYQIFTVLALLITIQTVYVPTGQLTVPFLRGSSLNTIVDSRSLAVDPIEAFERLAVKHQEKTKVLENLADLKGSVNIATEKDALDYVRLRTSPSTWYLWHNTQTVELLEKEKLSSVCNYGLPRYVSLNVSAGFMGVLPASVMKQAGIKMAVVEQSKKAYVIKRSLLTTSDHKSYSITEVEEIVYADGGYTQRIITKKRAPQLPGVSWQIPRFE